MGHVGDELQLQLFALYLLGQGGFQPVLHLVQCFRRRPQVGVLRQRDTGFAPRGLDAVKQPVHVRRGPAVFPEQPNLGCDKARAHRGPEDQQQGADAIVEIPVVQQRQLETAVEEEGDTQDELEHGAPVHPLSHRPAQLLPFQQPDAGGAEAVGPQSAVIVPQVVEVEVGPPQGDGDAEILYQQGKVASEQQLQRADRRECPKECQRDQQEQLDLQPDVSREPGDGPVGPHLVLVPYDGPDQQGEPHRRGSQQQAGEPDPHLGQLLDQAVEPVVVTQIDRLGRGGQRYSQISIGRVFRRCAVLVARHVPVLLYPAEKAVAVDVHRLAVLPDESFGPVPDQKEVIALGQGGGGAQGDVGVGGQLLAAFLHPVEQVDVLPVHGHGKAVLLLAVRGVVKVQQAVEDPADPAAKQGGLLVVCLKRVCHVGPGIVVGPDQQIGPGHSAVDQQRDTQHEGQKGQGGLNASQFCIQFPTPPLNIPAPLD